MTSACKLAAARTALAITHVLLGLLLLLPIAVVAGLSSLRALAKIPFGLMLLGLIITALPMGMLLAGIRAFWRLTPQTIRALQAADALIIIVALLLCVSGGLSLQAAAENAARGGGLLGGFGVIPLALGISMCGLAIPALWLLRYVSRHTADKKPKETTGAGSLN